MEQAREEGKTHFSAKRFSQALESYSQALRLALSPLQEACGGGESRPEPAGREHGAGEREQARAATQCLTNRAVCQVKLSHWSAACSDASLAVSISLAQQSETLSKPLFLLGKALYQRAMEARLDREIRDLLQDSLAALQYLTLIDPNNTEGCKLESIVSKKVSASCPEKNVKKVKSAIEDNHVIDESVSKKGIAVSPGRQVVSCTFQNSHVDDSPTASISNNPSVHPVVQRALLAKLLTKHRAVESCLSSLTQQQQSVLSYFVSDYENSALSESVLSAGNESDGKGLTVDTSLPPPISQSSDGTDGPCTPSSYAAYHQFPPLSQLEEKPPNNTSESPTQQNSKDKPNNESGEWKFCNVCRDAGDLRCSRCKAVHYCSARCQSCDWPFHKRICRSAKPSSKLKSEHLQESTSDDIAKDDHKKKVESGGGGLFASLKSLSPSKFRQDRSSLSKFGGRKTCRGIGGLANLGNTCYLNSSLQCLSHVYPLVKYFITNEYQKHVNTTSLDSTKGVFAKEFASLLKQLWLRPFPPSPLCQPVAFRRVLGHLNRDYATFQQQDAHDLLAFVLDKLHEDVNLVSKKPNTETSEVKSLDDVERVGKENWEKHLMRHDSAVQDVVGGFLKSQIVCPLLKDCGKISVTFDYTSTVQLAIPQPKRDREKRDRSGSIGSLSGRDRRRTSSGHSQYMDLLVNNNRGRSSSIDALSLPISFMPQIPLVEPPASDISKFPSHGGVLALSSLNHLADTLPIRVTVDEFKRGKLFSVKQKLTNSLLRCVKFVYKSLDNTPFKRREEGELLLLELEEAPSTGGCFPSHLVAPGSCEGFITSRLLQDKDVVASIVSSDCSENNDNDEEDDIKPAPMAAYWVSSQQAMKTPNFCFLMQKIAIAGDFKRGQEDGEDEDDNHERIVGIPLLLSYDASWSCTRFRYEIWRQVRRFVSAHANKHTVDMLSSDEEEEENLDVDDENIQLMKNLLDGNIETQMELSRNLRIRLVDRQGTPQAGISMLSSSENDEKTDAAEIGSNIRKLKLNCSPKCQTQQEDEATESIDHLSYLPVSDSKSVRDFIGEDADSFSFFSVEYIHGWLHFVDGVALSSFQPLSAEGELLNPISTCQEVDDEGSLDHKQDPFSGIEHDSMDISHLNEKNLLAVSSPPKPTLNRVVADGVITLEDCLQLYTAEEVLDEANSWYCNQCKTHREAFKTLQFYKLPPVLIFGLKRFETRSMSGMMMYGGGGGVYREKVSSFVDFPLNGLDMQPYCKPLPPLPGSETDDMDERYLYDLVSVCNHYGRMGFGHYTAFAREWDGSDSPLRNDTWCCYDDEIIHPMDAKSVKTSAAYILVYRRRKF